MEEEGSLPVAAWLAALHLDQYVESFQQSNLWSVWDCRALTDEGKCRGDKLRFPPASPSPAHAADRPCGVPAACPVLLPPELPCKASVPFVPEFDDSDYEDSAWEEELARPVGEMAKPDAFPGGSPGTLGDSMEGTGATAPLSPTIRAGWLDKNPPQGSYIYQKRWVKLDADYLRYFDSEKDAYSKRLIPVSSISRVTSVGDQKFEVITNNRNFVFRAESDAERNEWIRTLQQIAEERKSKAPERTLMSLATDGAPEPADKSGFLELRGFKHKLFVVVAGDKVFLYKNAEDYRLGIGITYIEMNVGNVKEVDHRGFDLTTPYRLFSFSADSEQEKEEWVEAMQQSIAEALSNSEVAERIWAVESNRCCADCGSPKPEWASINLCVVICKRCAGEHRGLGPGITKVRSLKMDRKVWTEELIKLFQQFGNAMANEFWAANVPPSEAIGPTSGSQERRRFLIAKYREGKYRHYHPLFGNQEELDRVMGSFPSLPAIQGEHEVLVLVERRRPPGPAFLGVVDTQWGLGGAWPPAEASRAGRTLYIQGERKLDFLGWVHAIQKAAGSSGDTLSEQQLTESDVPLLVDRCIDYITQCGLTSEGIYRKSGQNSKTTSLLEVLQRDARRVRLKEGEHHVDDVANTLKRFFRDLGDGLFTRQWAPDWLWATALEDEEAKVSEYRQLLGALPPVNRATLKALINHLFRVQCFSGENQMNTHNLAIVFGPTLFQTDGKDYKAGRVVEDLINHYVKIFNVNDQEMKKQQDEIMAIMKMREASSSGMQQAGDFICTVYLEEKKTETEQHVKIPATMTAEELTFEILDRRKIVMKEKDYWSCFEVNEREEAERPLHYSEKVLPILHCLGTESYLVVKKQMSMENMLIYLASRVGDCKHGMMKFREERNLLGLGLSTGFHDRYFILNHSCLRLYKEVRSLRQRSPPLESSHKPEKEWPVRNLKVYLGVKKKLRPPTCWGFTVFYENEKHEKQQWYLCCDTQADLREWFATFLQVQNGGALWPSERPRTRAARPQQDTRLGNISLIPLRGNESEMRNSVAAFATDPLTLLRNV
ncbi:arf-GAP with Rho-GAP domain, ANK repeat and PH domain-containing protein 1 [Manacus vitellinus]|uniref:arf-GAP with Rho-GAP domain, ANK repeat and PH domain-containing protein 1 n=1 Tax=Manacus vitellinus TaxID=328815 RepID=UPI00115C87D0|nr:arf-GAP with Rho-GAP domain, ANK repeat and PH domain-containing protein 1 [Manacus vitellinus]